MKITSIERNKKGKNRLLVCIDDQYGFTVTEEDFIRLNLYDKQDISQEEIDYIRKDLNYNAAKSISIRFMALKLRCEHEVRFKLNAEGYDPDVIDRVISELKSMGYINDKIYTQKYIYDRSKLKPKSKRLLKLELKNIGITEEIIDEVLNDWQIEEDLVAASLVRKKFGKYDLNDEKVIKKAYSFLLHRGFSYDLIKEVINSVRDDSK
jgi:regulatory protein